MQDGMPQALADEGLQRRILLIADSYRRFLGRPLCDSGSLSIEDLWNAPRVIVAHGTGTDPVFFFGNRMALDLFETGWDAFVRMPSRLSAEPLARDERAHLLARVSADGFIDDYAGVRISARGRRFRIEQAEVWNLVDADNVRYGQAATFERWRPLDSTGRPV